MAKQTKRSRRRYFSRPRRRSNGFRLSLPVAAILGFLPLGQSIYTGFNSGGITQASRVGLRSLTGYDTASNTWNWVYMKTGAIPIAIGLLIHKVVGGTLGVNRMIARTGIPFIRI